MLIHYFNVNYIFKRLKYQTFLLAESRTDLWKSWYEICLKSIIPLIAEFQKYLFILNCLHEVC